MKTEYLKEIDNSVAIGRFITAYFKDYITENSEYFWSIQLILRSKDNAELTRLLNKNGGNTNRPFLELFIHNEEELNNKMELIRRICDATGARAYINLTPKSYKKVARQALYKITDAVCSDNWKAAKRAYWSATGSTLGEKKLFLLDIDTYEGEDVAEVAKTLETIFDSEVILLSLPTKGGWHLICKPFDTMKFGKEWPGIKVLKNTPTLLYFNYTL